MKFALLFAICSLLARTAVAADACEHHQKPVGKPAGTQAASRVDAIPDVTVRTQDGKAVKFYSDLIKGKTVAVNFVYTTCTTVCPPMGAIFGRLQQEHKPHIGKDEFLVSVSIDPAIDTPARLKAWGSRFGVGPGWTLVTGAKEDIDRILKAMNIYVPNVRDHQPVTVVGNDATGQWQRSYGFTTAARLGVMLDELGREVHR